MENELLFHELFESIYYNENFGATFFYLPF